ncbi:hypothetical protein N6H18_03860 [Reichenbachiella agarivorans]|uniref:Lipocalin-like domain-containing protein n=1 Tax=Reichenbachiella agarivorans TaxID=2979464 RepID=A0ABY6CY02_9BACT|nr:hypothetical protein [Reichenbachiella agarivorans]UXP33090.1 hypothetical protein N6H18_03860 [Reichenbachiella agarivorans]
MYKYRYTLLLLSLAMLGCVDEHSSQIESKRTQLLAHCESTDRYKDNQIIGTWGLYPDPNTGYFSFTAYTFTFYEDGTFDMLINGFTDAISLEDPCGYTWKHYIHGGLFNNGDQKYFCGIYTDEKYKEPAANCNGDQFYHQMFTVDDIKNEQLTLIFYETHNEEEYTYEVVLTKE